MSTKQDWRERWEEKDRDGDTVTDVALWSDGTAAKYTLIRRESMNEGICNQPERLIPRKPAPVVVPWEPDEVPVGAVVRWKNNSDRYGVITNRSDDRVFLIGEGYITCQQLFGLCVLHQPGVPTSDCQPCGKVVQQ